MIGQQILSTHLVCNSIKQQFLRLFSNNLKHFNHYLPSVVFSKKPQPPSAILLKNTFLTKHIRWLHLEEKVQQLYRVKHGFCGDSLEKIKYAYCHLLKQYICFIIIIDSAASFKYKENIVNLRVSVGFFVNSLSTNRTKQTDTLKQFVGCFRRIV